MNNTVDNLLDITYYKYVIGYILSDIYNKGER